MEDRPSKEAIVEEFKGGFALIDEDVLQQILSRLPAKSFAFAACVCSSWTRVCARILSRPNLLSALSLNPNLERAVDEAIDRVLAEPIRPHFAIAFVGKKFSLKSIHRRVTRRLGSGIPIIINKTPGIIGADALTDEFREVKWVKGDTENSYNSARNADRGLVLVVGFVPGLRVRAVPLLNLSSGSSLVSSIDKFVTDIKDFATSVSGCSSPVGIIMFADQWFDMKLVLEKLDYAMSKDTAIVGDDGSCGFLYSNGADSIIMVENEQISSKSEEHAYKNLGLLAVGLVFAMEKESSHGEIQFSVALSTGVSPLGPIYKGASVRVVNRNNNPDCATWLTARREGSIEEIGGIRIIQDIDHEQVADDVFTDDLYIGVVRRRKCSIGPEKVKWISSIAFTEVKGADEEHLFVKGDGIKTGDQFQFYQPDPDSALSSRNRVLEDFKALKLDGCSKHEMFKSGCGNRDTEVFGGLIFCCFGRGESFFGHPNVDSSALTDNFPGLPIGGMFCFGEIGRSAVAVRGTPVNCFFHVYSTVYLLMLYKPRKP
ncbi:hypothetical protein Syun_024526 [Stephania yunnanensis]|uniref:FIST C-domain domain-containing protein n=1 Tax=Stephania yunnanensis TaxID=152371 RepID=A0AAP0I4J3_9MAGN